MGNVGSTFICANCGESITGNVWEIEGKFYHRSCAFNTLDELPNMCDCEEFIFPAFNYCPNCGKSVKK
jgi:predicted RNA-binding Zn-ribbon protein involved in translation (DUF1610 family)